MRKLTLTSVLITSLLTVYSQIVFIGTPLSYSINSNNSIIDSNNICFRQYNYQTANFERILRISINQSNIDTSSVGVPHILSNYHINDLYSFGGMKFFIRVNEPRGSSNIFSFYSANSGQIWKQLVAPDTKSTLFAITDTVQEEIYFYKSTLDGIYIFSNKLNQWDSVSFASLKFEFVNITNKRGLLKLFNANEIKIASTTDGAKTYQILTNIDYSKPPFSKTQNGMLEKLVIVTDDYWLAQHTYDSSALNQITKVYYTTDRGTTWKVLFNFGVKSIVPASNSTVYISDQGGPTNDLYQVSNYGTKVCLTSFKGAISSMYFWNADRGLILTIDTPNKQPGIWRVTNGGGAPCSITGITETITKNGSLNLYPNPATNQLTVSNYFVPSKTRYIIYSILGKQVEQGVLQEKETNINLSNLASGLYFIKIGDSTVKFVKE